MDIKNAVAGNWRTSVIGFLGGIVYYLNDAGLNIPTTKEAWKAVILSVALAWLGSVAKDAATGSKAVK